MPDYFYVVVVDAANREQADQVMQERVCFEEDYGFNYGISWHYPYAVGFGPRDGAATSQALLDHARAKNGADGHG